MKVEKAVESVAQAFAKAVVATYASCTSTGNASGSASATAKAEAQASATVEALAKGWASVQSCNGCYAAAELFSFSFKEVLAEAVAQSKSEVGVTPFTCGLLKYAMLPRQQMPPSRIWRLKRTLQQQHVLQAIAFQSLLSQEQCSNHL